jgi:hypothetical protein
MRPDVGWAWRGVPRYVLMAGAPRHRWTSGRAGLPLAVCATLAACYPPDYRTLCDLDGGLDAGCPGGPEGDAHDPTDRPPEGGASLQTPTVGVTLDSLTLFQNEETYPYAPYMAVYVYELRVDGPRLERFRWNNCGQRIPNRPQPYSLGDCIVGMRYFADVASTLTLMVEGYTRFESSQWPDASVESSQWPDAIGHDHSLGSATLVINPGDSSHRGVLHLGPTKTDRGRDGYAINVIVQ